MICTPGRGTCVPECSSYGWCHCGCGNPTNVAKGTRHTRGERNGRHFKYVRFHHNHSLNRGLKHTRNGVPMSRLRPELEALVRSSFTQKRAAEQMGVSRAWMCRALSGEIQRTSLSMALRLAEAVRGGRGLAEEHHQAEIARERNERRAALKRERRRIKAEAEV